MLPSEARAAIIDELEATTLDSKARANDKFVVLRQALEPESVTERAIMVRLIGGPWKTEDNTCDLYRSVWQVVRFYGSTPDIDDRIANDCVRVDRALTGKALAARDADIEDCQVSPQTLEDKSGMQVARNDVTVLFRVDL